MQTEGERSGNIIRMQKVRDRMVNKLTKPAQRRQRFGWLLIPSGTLVWPGIMQHDAEPEESQDHELVEKEM
jgi:hypothetical protein